MAIKLTVQIKIKKINIDFQCFSNPLISFSALDILLMAITKRIAVIMVDIAKALVATA